MFPADVGAGRDSVPLDSKVSLTIYQDTRERRAGSLKGPPPRAGAAAAEMVHMAKQLGHGRNRPFYQLNQATGCIRPGFVLDYQLGWRRPGCRGRHTGRNRYRNGSGPELRPRPHGVTAGVSTQKGGVGRQYRSSVRPIMLTHG